MCLPVCHNNTIIVLGMIVWPFLTMAETGHFMSYDLYDPYESENGGSDDDLTDLINITRKVDTTTSHPPTARVSSYQAHTSHEATENTTYFTTGELETTASSIKGILN